MSSNIYPNRLYQPYDITSTDALRENFRSFMKTNTKQVCLKPLHKILF